MTEQYHQMEHDLGIETYASPTEHNPGFAAVVKAKYSDFLVHEVDPDGNQALLNNLEYNETNPDISAAIKKQQEKDEENTLSKKAKVEESTETSQDPKETISDASPKDEQPLGDIDIVNDEEDAVKDIEEAHVQLSKIVSEETSRQAMDLLLYWLKNTKSEAKSKTSTENDSNTASEKMTRPEKNFIFPLIEEKLTRTQIHKLIKGPLLHKHAVADTIDGKIRLWPQQFKKHSRDKFYKDNTNKNNPTQNKRKRPNDRSDNTPKLPPWPKDRPKYTKFVLYKENCDTNTALKDIIRLSNRQIKPNTRFNVAGMKDKRGITTQYCTVYQIHPSQLLCLNHYWYDAKSKQPYKQNQKGGGGGHSSNAGTTLIKVGNFSFTNDDLRLGKLSGNRFDIVLRNVDITTSSSESTVSTSLSTDKRYNDTHSKLEQAADAFRTTGFINYFGMQRFGKNQDTHKVGIEILKGNFEKAVDIIMCIKSDEPQRFRRAKQRWLDRFANLPPSDQESSIEGMKKHEEQKCAKAILHQLGRFMTCEISLMRSLSRKPRDYKTAFRCIQKNIQLMFLHAVQSYIWNRVVSFRIAKGGGCDAVMVGDLVLIGDKSKDEGGSGTSGRVGKTVKVVTEDDVSNKTFDITNVVLPLPGSRIDYPTNSTGKFYDTVLEELGMSSVMWKQTNREFSLGGDYRNIICKPSDITYEIKRYYDPKAPLLKTDLMHIQGKELGNFETKDDSDSCQMKENNAGIGDEITDENKDEETKEENKPNDISEKKEELLGLVIGFTLPPSSYATIALRELMKRPTCSAYQSKLSLYGKCEGNLAKSSCIKTEKEN